MDNNIKKVVALTLFVLCLVGSLIIAPQLYENVQAGTYHITQSPFTGVVTARLQPGPYAQFFADVNIFPVSETFYFTKDPEGGPGDYSIHVQFNDGSLCQISGTCRIDLPRTEDECVKLMTKFGYRNIDQIEDKLILPVIRRAMVLSANQMSAKESYSERRANFIADAWDQIENGIYVTKDQITKEADPVSGQMVTKISKVPVIDSKGVKVREHNPLKGTGITISNFEIKQFMYEQKVQAQIATQQQALMEVQTAKANALKAEQDALTAEAKGKADVMKSKYEKEQEKIKATVDAEKEQAVAVIKAEQLVKVAEKDKEQALIAANKLKEVAVVELEAAKLEKQRTIALAEGQAESKRMILAADNALQYRGELWIKGQEVWANAFKERRVPNVIMGSKDGSGSDNDIGTFMNLINIKAAKDLAIDLNMNPPTHK